jgi:hypothetical protein
MNIKLFFKLKNEEKKNIRFFTAKNGDEFVLIKTPTFEKKLYNLISIYRIKNFKYVGEINYKTDLSSKNTVYLNNIFIINKKDYFCGIGSYTIKFFEEVVFNDHFCYVSGKFYPHSNATRQDVEKFYNRNGYAIIQEEHLEIGKTLKPDIIEKISKNTYKDKYGFTHYGPLKDMPDEHIEPMEQTL